jgi:hypothetical protein
MKKKSENVKGKRLGQKREVPFQRGEIEIWAAAILHAIG